VSIYEVIALYEGVSPAIILEFAGNEEAIKQTAAGLCQRFNKTAE
jgi:hypothetical protein